MPYGIAELVGGNVGTGVGPVGTVVGTGVGPVGAGVGLLIGTGAIVGDLVSENIPAKEREQ